MIKSHPAASSSSLRAKASQHAARGHACRFPGLYIHRAVSDHRSFGSRDFAVIHGHIERFRVRLALLRAVPAQNDAEAASDAQSFQDAPGKSFRLVAHDRESCPRKAVQSLLYERKQLRAVQKMNLVFLLEQCHCLLNLIAFRLSAIGRAQGAFDQFLHAFPDKVGNKRFRQLRHLHARKHKVEGSR